MENVFSIKDLVKIIISNLNDIADIYHCTFVCKSFLSITKEVHRNNILTQRNILQLCIHNENNIWYKEKSHDIFEVCKNHLIEKQSQFLIDKFESSCKSIGYIPYPDKEKIIIRYIF